jgi:hypothetical protein
MEPKCHFTRGWPFMSDYVGEWHARFNMKQEAGTSKDKIRTQPRLLRADPNPRVGLQNANHTRALKYPCNEKGPRPCDYTKRIFLER